MLTDPTRPCWYLPCTDRAALAAWLALAVCCPPALAQDTSPAPAASPQGTSDSFPLERCGGIPTPTESALIPVAPVVLPGSPVFTQSSPNLSAEKGSEKKPPVSYGAEIVFQSGHADRGFVISDRPVVQSEAWVSGRGVEFSLWNNLTLAETRDGSRPRILEMELSSEHQWRKLTIEPAITMYFYNDALNRSSSSDRSIESWLYLSYHAGPFRLFTNHSFDVLTYRGAYFGEAGIELERRVSRVKVGGSFSTGWASAAFNDEYADIRKSALNRISVEGWLKAYLQPHFYIRPHFEFSSIVDRALRTEVERPTFVFFGLTTGVEF
jgi:hypothetical protein